MTWGGKSVQSIMGTARDHIIFPRSPDASDHPPSAQRLRVIDPTYLEILTHSGTENLGQI